MDWYGDIPHDPEYPISDEYDGLDQLTREELKRIRRQQEEDDNFDIPV